MSTFGLAALNVAAHAAEEALASRDTTSSNLQDTVDGSSNPLVLVDDAMTTLRLGRNTRGGIDTWRTVRYPIYAGAMASVRRTSAQTI